MSITRGPWWEIRAKAGADTAEILIYSDIGESWDGSTVAAKDFVTALDAITADYLTVRINSYGGSVTDGLAIFNALKRKKCAITVEIDGIAASIASLIAMAGDTVRMSANTLLMVHAPWGVSMGNATALREMADVLDTYAKAMETSYLRPGVDQTQIHTWLTDGQDHWLTAEEALAASLIDEIAPALAVAASVPDRYRIRGKAAASPTEAIMADIPQAAASDTPTAPNVTEIQAAADKKARETAQARLSDLKTRFDAFSAANPGRLDVVRAAYDTAVADLDATADTFTTTVLAKLIEGAAPVAGTSGPRVHQVVDARDKFRVAASAAIGARMGIEKDDRANEFRGMRLSEIAAACLRQVGVDTTGWTADQIASRVVAASMSTGDFDYLLMDAANKRLQTAFSAFPATWRTFSAVGSVSDFKTVNLVKLGSFNDLDLLPELAQYQMGNFSDARETLTPRTKGKKIALSRQMIINDDLNGFSRIAGMLGQAAARTINKDVYSVINSNPTMADGTTLYHATRTNLAGSGTAVTVASLSAGRAAMRQYKDIGGRDYLNILPRTLLVPVGKEDNARVIVESGTDVDTTAALRKNPIRDWGPLEIVSDPYLDAASATAWYLFADPMDAPAIEVDFLNGTESPYVDQNPSWENDAIEWKIRLDYGVAANEWRGTYKNIGA